jgi:hypothetical protein
VPELPELLTVSDPVVFDFSLASEAPVFLKPKNVGPTPMAMEFRRDRHQSE